MYIEDRIIHTKFHSTEFYSKLTYQYSNILSSHVFGCSNWPQMVNKLRKRRRRGIIIHWPDDFAAGKNRLNDDDGTFVRTVWYLEAKWSYEANCTLWEVDISSDFTVLSIFGAFALFALSHHAAPQGQGGTLVSGLHPSSFFSFDSQSSAKPL